MAFAIPDDRKLSLPHLLGNIAIGVEPGAGSIEEAVPQDKPLLETLRSCFCAFITTEW